MQTSTNLSDFADYQWWISFYDTATPSLFRAPCIQTILSSLADPLLPFAQLKYSSITVGPAPFFSKATIAQQHIPRTSLGLDRAPGSFDRMHRVLFDYHRQYRVSAGSNQEYAGGATKMSENKLKKKLAIEVYASEGIEK